MTKQAVRASLLAALPLLVAAGCASAGAQTTKPMAMGDDSAMHMNMPSAASGATGPSAAASMVCGDEIEHDVATILALPTPPHSISSWQPPVFTCTYHLASGPLVVSVTESGTPAAAQSHFADLRGRLGSTQSLHGLDSLGLPAFESSSGVVAFVKDDKTLEIDPTQLPEVVNGQQRTRSDLAYTLATDILGCWNGD